MAKQRCRCGETSFWKADEPHSDEWLMVAKSEVPEDLNDFYRGPISHTTSAALCSNCGRLWVAWRNENPVIEYLPVDHPGPGADRG